MKAKEVLGINLKLFTSMLLLVCIGNRVLIKLVNFVDTVMNIYSKTMTEDDDKEVVAQACMSIADIIKDYGYMALEPCK